LRALVRPRHKSMRTKILKDLPAWYVYQERALVEGPSIINLEINVWEVSATSPAAPLSGVNECRPQGLTNNYVCGSSSGPSSDYGNVPAAKKRTLEYFPLRSELIAENLTTGL
jgi:hypothetical protein